MLVANAPECSDACLMQKIVDRIAAEEGVLVFVREVVPELLEKNRSFAVASLPEEVDHFTEGSDHKVLPFVEDPSENTANRRAKQIAVRHPVLHKRFECLPRVEPDSQSACE